MDVPILELAKWTRRLAETHLALGRAKKQQIEQWGDAYLSSTEPSATGAINTANAATSSSRAVVAKLEHDALAETAVVDFLRRVTTWSDGPYPDDPHLSPFPRNE